MYKNNKILKVKKREGWVVDFDQKKIMRAILKAIKSSLQREDLKLAERLSDFVLEILNKKYSVKNIPTIEEIQDVVIEILKVKAPKEVYEEYSGYRAKRSEIRKLKYYLISYDVKVKLSDNALKILESRYLQKDENGKIVETPTQLFQRVAHNIAEAEKIYNPSISDDDLFKVEEEFFKIMARLEFLPNSPTLMNAGNPLQQLSACFVIEINDSMDSIFESLKNTAKIHQSGGGTGFDFSNLRPKDDNVRSTAGIASGPISFMEVFDKATEVVKQGGKRRGANMGILRIDHPDILDFITAKMDQKKLQNFNISVGITNDFMEAVLEDGEYELINPRNSHPVKKMKAKDVFNMICKVAWETGDPGLVFLDEINNEKGNPTPSLGKIKATNPCIAKGAYIATDYGMVEIEKVHNPMQVMTVNDLRPLRWIGKTGKKEVFKIVTAAGYEVDATANHKILTNNGWKRVCDLTKKDKLTLQPQGVFGNLRLDKEMALACGWLLGDGSLTKQGRIIWFFNKREKSEILPIFKKYFDSINGRPVKETEGLTEFKLKYALKISKIFQNMGFQPLKSNKKFIPAPIFQLNKKSMKEFLSALFACDGSVQGSKAKGISIRLSSNSLKLLKQVQILLLQFGVLCKVYENRRKRHFKLLPDVCRKPKLYPCEPQHELIISRESMFKFMNQIGFCLDVKNRKFEELKPKKIYKDNIDLRIKEIKNLGLEDVYDISEPATRSFVANGIVVHNCGEVPLLSYESCNLGSINLMQMLKEIKVNKFEVDWEKLERTVKIAMRFLDNVVDMNRYPLPEIEKMSRGNRRIGLGVMGFSDMLIKMKIAYDSNEAIKLAGKIMKFIDDKSDYCSRQIAKERGVFPNYRDSIFYTNKIKVRNCATTTIAPTGTIGLIAGVSQGIEPIFAIAYERFSYIGREADKPVKLIEVNPLFEEVAKRERFYSKKLMEKVLQNGSARGLKEVSSKWQKIFATAHDISPEYHLRMQAAFQKHTDNGVSKTVNLPNNATIEDVKKIYLLAYKLKCKGVTIFRSGSKQMQILNVGTKNDENKEEIQEKKSLAQQDKEVPPHLKNPSNEGPDVPPGICLTCL